MCKICFITADAKLDQKNCSGTPTHRMEIPWICCICGESFCQKCVYNMSNNNRVNVGKTSLPQTNKHFCVNCLEQFRRGAKSKL